MSEGKILWKQLTALTALYASVIIGWIAYYNYQPKLLEKYEFNDLTMFLFIAQGIILVITPMIAGRLGDKYRHSAGKRLPIISAGISFAAMIFMSVAFTLIIDPGPVFKWILPFLIIFWLFSMALFTSPAISTIELFVPAKRLPRAMAMLTVVYGLLYAVEPVIVFIIDTIGAPLTFVVGGVAVFFSGLALKRTTGDIVDVPKKVSELGKSDYSYALVLGIVFGIVTTILFNLVPEWLDNKGVVIFDLEGSAEVSMVLAAVAVFSVPISRYVESRSVHLSVLVSVLALFAVIAGLYYVENSAVIIFMLILFALFYAMMSVSFLPLALSIVKDNNKVFGVGVFFAGFELPNGVLEAILVATGSF